MDIENDFVQVAEKIAQNEGIEDPNLEFQYASEKGEGYMGIIKALKLNGKNKSLDLIFKYSLKNEKARETMSTRDAFVQEIIFYEEVVKTFKNFQEEYKVEEPFNNTAKCYFTTDEPVNELLVLENLKNSGYGLWQRQILMNKEHLEFVLQTYAKFQATSMALRTLKPQEYSRLKNLLSRFDGEDFFSVLTRRMGFIDQLHKISAELLEVFDRKTESVYYEKFKKFGQSIEQHINDSFAYHDDEVISQGDSWVNNMMFKYANDQDKSAPIDMKIIDFQLAFSRPAILDLSYLFYANASKENLKNFDHFLKVYHESLAKHLSKFGCDVNDVFPFDKLLDTWAKYSKYGLLWSLFLRKGMLGETSEIPDIAEVAQSQQGLKEAFSYISLKEDEYRSQVKDLIVHYVDRKFI